MIHWKPKIKHRFASSLEKHGTSFSFTVLSVAGIRFVLGVIYTQILLSMNIIILLTILTGAKFKTDTSNIY